MKSPTKTLLGLLAGLVFGTTLTLADVTVGQPFPKLADFNLSGQLPDLNGRVVLVDFWATWCAPCRESFPAYDSLQRELGERGLTIVGVSVDKNEDRFNGFVGRFTPGFVTVLDAKQKLAAAVHPLVMPTSYLIDRHGVVQAVHSGFHGATTVRQLREEINKLLEEKS